MEGFECTADIGELLGQVRRHFGAVGFVTAIIYYFEGLGFGVVLAQGHRFRAFVAEDLSADVEDGSEVFRLEVAAQFVDHVYEDICCRCRHTVARGHGPLPLHRMVGAEDEGHRIEQEDRLFIGRRHRIRVYRLREEHAVSIGEEAITCFHRVFVGCEHVLASAEGAY